MRCIVIVSLLALVVSCNDSAPKKAAKKPARRKAYAMQNVNGWEEKRGTDEVDRTWTAPADGPDDPYLENVNVGFAEVPRGTTVKKFLQEWAEDLAFALMAKEKVRFEETKVNGLKAHVARIENVENGVDLVLDCYMVFDGRHVFVISCSAAAQDYESYKPKFEEMLETFSLK